MLIDIQDLKITCLQSGKQLSRITKAHAETLGYTTLKAYREATGLQHITAAQRARGDFKRLYNLDFKRWVSGFDRGDGDGMTYGTKTYDPTGKSAARSAVPFPLADNTFSKHLTGESPLAVFAHGDGSRYFVLDVDTKETAAGDTLKLIEVMTSIGIDREHIHVSFSGSKGYHIELYVDGRLKFKDWEKLGIYVIYSAGFTEKEIEMRPNVNNSLAVKLPLTLHPKTKLFAGYCDNAMNILDVQTSYEYLAAIQPSSAVDMRQLTDRIEITHDKEPDKPKPKRQAGVKVVDNRLYQSSEQKRDSAVRILTHGLSNGGTRWNAMRNTLIPYLKIEVGCDPDETRDILNDFCANEYAAGRSATVPEESAKQVDDLIRDFYPLVDGIYSIKRDIEVTRGEIEWVVNVVERGGTRLTRDLLWALLLMRKAYGDKKGDFFASRERVQSLLSKPRTISPSTIQKSRNWLSDNNFIQYEVPENSYKLRKATTYLLNYEESGEIVTLDQVYFDEEMDSRELFRKITERLYTPRELKLLKVT